MGLALAALMLAAGANADTVPCNPGKALAYVCGPEKPEDVLALPGTNWLVASGFAAGAGLKLVNIRSRSFTRWFSGAPDQIAWDRRAYGRCPGPVDPALFNARGLSLRPTGAGSWRLLVVNHGGRQSIEVFDIAAGQDAPTLRWRGCLLMPGQQVGNSVASFSDGTILATVLTRPGTSITDFVQGRTTGGVWQWRPGEQEATLLQGTELPGNNGLETDPDDRHFYVIAFGWHAVLIYDRHDMAKPPARIEAPDFMPDNIHWSEGRLLLAGMRLDEPACGGLRQIVNGVADPMACHRGWIVGALDPATRRVATLAYGTPEADFNGLSAATIANGQLWLGSYQSDRLAVVEFAGAGR